MTTLEPYDSESAMKVIHTDWLGVPAVAAASDFSLVIRGLRGCAVEHGVEAALYEFLAQLVALSGS